MCRKCLPDKIAFLQEAALGASVGEAANTATRMLNKFGDMLNDFNDAYESGGEVYDLVDELLAQGLISALFTLAAASRSPYGFVLLPECSVN
jgi:hypothetical protein